MEINCQIQAPAPLYPKKSWLKLQSRYGRGGENFLLLFDKTPVAKPVTSLLLTELFKFQNVILVIYSTLLL